MTGSLIPVLVQFPPSGPMKVEVDPIVRLLLPVALVKLSVDIVTVPVNVGLLLEA